MKKSHEIKSAQPDKQVAVKISKPLSSLGPYCRNLYKTLQQHGPLCAEELSKLMPEGYQYVRTLRGRLSDLHKEGLVGVDHTVLNKHKRKVRVYSAVAENGCMNPSTGSSLASSETRPKTIVAGHDRQIQKAIREPAHEPSPDILKHVEEECQFIESRSLHSVRRVNIEEVSDAWLCRFLPVGLGIRNLWYVRLGQHLMHGIPILCPRCVSPDFGGDPSAACPVCEVADFFKAHEDEEISTFGLTIEANLTYLTYCLVYQIESNGGELQERPLREVLKPWQFHHAVDSFLALADYFLCGQTADRPYSVLDIDKGNDFWATNTSKGIRLERQDPASILDISDSDYEALVSIVFSNIRQPKIKIPTAKELENFARKARSLACGQGR